MSLKTHKIDQGLLPRSISNDRQLSADEWLRDTAINKWLGNVVASEADDPNTISIYDPIGESFFSEGFTAKRMAGALRSIGNEAITVNINSPGGSVFEGVAIYNMLADHPAPVKVKVLGLAASIASIIAMAGDEIEISEGAFFMIHRASTIGWGNTNDFTKIGKELAVFDDALSGIYSSNTGIESSELLDMMNEETWLNADKAVEMGFADSKTERKIKKAESAARDLRALKRDFIKNFKGTRKNAIAFWNEIHGLNAAEGKPSAAENVMPSADETALISALRTAKNNGLFK